MTLLSCVLCMALVGWIAYLKTRGEVATQEGYFLAGRGLTGVFIAGSLLLTNLSAEQLIGLNGSAYAFNMSSMAWEVTAGFAIIIMALVFLPRYLSGAFATLPQFLEDRFDAGVRRLSVVLFLLGYGLITIPSILYSGALAVMQIFDVPGLLGVGFSTALLVTILVIGCVGGIYAVFGGLRAVAVSDTLNGVGLLVIGALIPVLGLMALGEGSALTGLRVVLSEDTHKLNAIGSTADPVPFSTLFTGMLLANLFYWGTNQYVIQRTLGARSLADGQKGVLLSGFFKLLVPFFMLLPGIIAYHLYADRLTPAASHMASHMDFHMDWAYPTLVAEVLPEYLAGVFLAVLLGAVFSSFNSLLNSAATLFCLDIYQPLRGGRVADATMIRVARVASVVVAMFSFVVAPLLQYAPDGLWQIIRIFTGFYNIPIITLVLVGLFTRKVPALAARVVVIFHIVAYAILQFVLQVDMNFMHIYAVLFVIEVSLMLIIGWWRPLTKPWRYHPAPRVDLIPWRYAGATAVLLVACIVLSYLLFSPLGVAGDLGRPFVMAAILVVCAAAVGCWWCNRRWRQTYAGARSN